MRFDLSSDAGVVAALAAGDVSKGEDGSPLSFLQMPQQFVGKCRVTLQFSEQRESESHQRKGREGKEEILLPEDGLKSVLILDSFVLIDFSVI
jgi:hypothetical protein